MELEKAGITDIIEELARRYDVSVEYFVSNVEEFVQGW